MIALPMTKTSNVSLSTCRCYKYGGLKLVTTVLAKQIGNILESAQVISLGIIN